MVRAVDAELRRHAEHDVGRQRRDQRQPLADQDLPHQRHGAGQRRARSAWSQMMGAAIMQKPRQVSSWAIRRMRARRWNGCGGRIRCGGGQIDE
jgi:hypothetical protein